MNIKNILILTAALVTGYATRVASIEYAEYQSLTRFFDCADMAVEVPNLRNMMAIACGPEAEYTPTEQALTYTPKLWEKTANERSEKVRNRYRELEAEGK